MKKALTILFTLLMVASVMAQHPDNHHGKKLAPPNWTEMVSGLTARQKNKLETITSESKVKVDKLQTELNSVRQQIRQLMMADGDNSKQLFALFDREGDLQAEISKEMYSTRVKVDQVLTAKQRKALKEKMEADMKARMAKKGHKGNHDHNGQADHKNHQKQSAAPATQTTKK